MIAPLIDNPVLRREIRGRIQLSRRTRLPFLILLPLIIYTYGRALINILSGSPADARDWFQVVSYILLAIMVILGPALSATAISQEREQQTWDAVKISLLTPAQIVAGKWIGRQMPLLFGVLLALPFLLADSIRGGHGLLAVVAVLLYIAGTAQTLVAFGLFCSMCLQRTQTAIAAALLSVAGICIGTPIAWGIAQSSLASPGAMNVAGSLGSTNTAAILAGMELNPFYVLYYLMTMMPSMDGGTVDASYARGIVIANVALQTAAAIFLMAALRRGIRRTAAQ